MEQSSHVDLEKGKQETPSDSSRAPRIPLPPLEKNVGKAERGLSIVAGLGLLLGGFARRGYTGVALGALGALLLRRGASGQCALYRRIGISGAASSRPGVPDNVGVNLVRSILIEKSPEELFAFWRHLPNVTRVMPRVKQVDLLDERRSHWVVKAPWGRRVEWDALLINEHPNALLAWESQPGARVENAGSIRFEPEPHGLGTVVTMKVEYNPPGGLPGRLGALLYGKGIRREIEKSLARFKSLMETGEAEPKKE